MMHHKMLNSIPDGVVFVGAGVTGTGNLKKKYLDDTRGTKVASKYIDGEELSEMKLIISHVKYKQRGLKYLTDRL
jgi:hypothetical protein